MSPFERVLSKLPEAQPVAGTSQKVWKVRCPAHKDSRPSLWVSLGDQGGALIHCHAGCPPEAVVAALGLTMADLMPQRPSHPPAAGTRASEPLLPTSGPKVFATSEEAVAELERTRGPASRTWTYHDDYEDPVGLILRWDTKDGKDIRPVSRKGEGWVLGGMDAPRPLYRLVELLQRRDERVYVTEGEKAADAANSLGLLATTSPHGSSSARKADWRPLAGRDVAILPDNDDAGRRYADDVASILLAMQPPAPTRGGAEGKVRIVALPDLGPREDIYNWLEHHDAVETHALRERLEKLVEAAPVCTVPARASLDSQDEKRTPHGVTANESRATSHEPRVSTPILVCADDVEETQVRWLWPGRVPLGRITMLVGRPGEGKSFLTTDMAARVTRGLPWPDGSACPEGSVLLISAEDDPRDTVRPRLRAHGADLKRVHLLSMVRRTEADGRMSDAMFSLADVDALDAAMQAHPDCRLVVVDPIGSFLGGSTDAHRDNDVRSVLVPVARVAERHDVAVLVVAHRRKSPSGNADDMALGSRAFTGIARAVWHLTRDSTNKARRLLLSGKNNLAAEGHGLAFTIEPASDGYPVIRWESNPVALTADEAMQEESEPAEGSSTSLADAMAWLQDALRDGRLPSMEVWERAQAEGISKRTLDRAKQRLRVRSYREGSCQSAVWFWEPSDARLQSQAQDRQESHRAVAGSLS